MAKDIVNVKSIAGAKSSAGVTRVTGSENLTDRIIRVLSSASYDLTINDIAAELGVERHTAAKNLATLRAQGLCEYRMVGRSKLWRLSESPILSLFTEDRSPLTQELASVLAMMKDRIIVQDKNLKVI